MSYGHLKVAELKDELKSRGLAVSGQKNQLIARLEEHDKARGTATPFTQTPPS